MTDLPTTLLLALIAVGFLALVVFLVGWNAAVHRYRAVQRRNTSSLQQLQRQMGNVRDALKTDPQRAAIDMGKQYAANEMQKTVDTLREELPK